jgi:hypothetical protein
MAVASSNHSEDNEKCLKIPRRLSQVEDVGFDFKDPPSSYYILIINGDRGTLIDGIFFLRGSFLEAPNMIGAAKDNRGHKYRIIGHTSI